MPLHNRKSLRNLMIFSFIQNPLALGPRKRRKNKVLRLRPEKSMRLQFQSFTEVLRESFGIPRVFQAVFPKNSRRTLEELAKNSRSHNEAIWNQYRREAEGL